LNSPIKNSEALAISSALRIFENREVGGIQYTFREAESMDAAGISDLFERAYGGKYLFSDTSAASISNEISVPNKFIWLITTVKGESTPMGCLLAKIDRENRIAKISNVVMLPGYARRTARRESRHQSLGFPDAVSVRKAERRSLGGIMLELVLEYLTNKNPIVDVVYATTRTINAAPARLGRSVGFRHAGFFPNAVWIQGFEHLNLEVFVTSRALRARRKCDHIFSALESIYSLAAQTFALETPKFTGKHASINESNLMHTFRLNQDQAEVSRRYEFCHEQGFLRIQFTPFLHPNCMLASNDGGGEIFVNYNASNRQAVIVDYWCSQGDIGSILKAAGHTLHELGAAYIEMLISAHDYLQQKQAYAAHYLPCAYLPAVHLARDGFRDDYFVFSRTCQPLDFEQCVISDENAHFLRAYLKLRQEHPAPFDGTSTVELACP
jgi:hypothetical protein